MISISYLSTVNKLTSSCKYICNGSVITTLNVCHIFEKMALSQFKVYIEVEKITQCYVCNNCKMSIFIQSYNVKEGLFCILQMLRIYNGLRKWNKKEWYRILLRDKNPMGINRQCMKIEKNEVLFEKFSMALKQDKDAI